MTDCPATDCSKIDKVVNCLNEKVPTPTFRGIVGALACFFVGSMGIAIPIYSNDMKDVSKDVKENSVKIGKVETDIANLKKDLIQAVAQSTKEAVKEAIKEARETEGEG